MLPAVVGPAVLLGVLWLVRPGVVENAARSPVAWLVSAGILAAALGARSAARRAGLPPLAARGVSLVVVAALLVAVLAPSFRQRSLVEDLPDELVAGPVPSTAPTPTPTPMPTTGRAGAPVSSGPASSAPSPQPPSAPASPPGSAVPSRSPAALVDSSGALEGIGHEARGTVRLRTAGDATFLLFDDVDIEGTVGPSVHLVPAGRREPGGGGIRVGDLKAERGTFSYRLPADLDSTREWSVLVWCDPYDTPIASATLRAGA